MQEKTGSKNFYWDYGNFPAHTKIIELARTTWKPRLLLRLLGLLLLRLETDALLALLFQLPPRLTRLEPDVVFPLYSLSLLFFRLKPKNP